MAHVTTREELADDIRDSVTEIKRQRAWKLVLVLVGLAVVLGGGMAIVYLEYSSAPGSMKPGATHTR